MLPKVSILVPSYNSEKFLAECLQSAMDQTWPNKEIIVVDDGSSDHSYKIAKSFESGTLKVFRQENKGACAARNKAFELSSGEYIQYLDADDLLHSSKIELQMQLFEKYGNNIITSCCWLKFYDDKSKARCENQDIDKDYPDPIRWLIDSWNGKGMGLTDVWLTPRPIIEKAGSWNESLLMNQDGEFFCRVLLKAKELKFCKNAFVYYRSGIPGSISHANNFSEKKAASLFLSYKLYAEHLASYTPNKDILNALARNYFSFIYQFGDKYPHLSAKAENELKIMPIDNSQTLGGPMLRMLIKILGVGKAIKLRKEIKHFINRVRHI